MLKLSLFINYLTITGITLTGIVLQAPLFIITGLWFILYILAFKKIGGKILYYYLLFATAFGIIAGLSSIIEMAGKYNQVIISRHQITQSFSWPIVTTLLIIVIVSLFNFIALIQLRKT